jgi:hypothetical protein
MVKQRAGLRNPRIDELAVKAVPGVRTQQHDALESQQKRQRMPDSPGEHGDEDRSEDQRGRRRGERKTDDGVPVVAASRGRARPGKARLSRMAGRGGLVVLGRVAD